MSFIYWISTSIISLFLLVSAFSYLFHQETINGVKELGFPSTFIVQLAVLKALAAVLLLLPSTPLFLKEWSYAGVFFFLLTAFVAHLAHKDSPFIAVLLVVLFVVTAVSYVYFKK